MGMRWTNVRPDNTNTGQDHIRFPRYTHGYSIVYTFTYHVAPGSAGWSWDCTLASLSVSGAGGWVGEPADYRRPTTLTQYLEVNGKRRGNKTIPKQHEFVCESKGNYFTILKTQVLLSVLLKLWTCSCPNYTFYAPKRFKRKDFYNVQKIIPSPSQCVSLGSIGHTLPQPART